MPKIHKPRFGSLQFWPRKRANKILPSVNWSAIEIPENPEKITAKKGILGFIGYKAGMMSAIIKDNTQDSLTKGKQIVFPVTIVECPAGKVLSVRMYKNGQVAKEIVASGIEKEKELGKKMLLPKKSETKIGDVENKLNDYDNIRLLVFSDVKSTGIKKTPDVSEIALGGTMQEKFEFAKKTLGHELKVEDVFGKNDLMDVRAVTKGKGFAGPVKRFGISLKQHKTEKGVRRPGALGPWHPAKVSFRAPLAGQLGFFTRVVYNNKIIEVGKASEKNINPKGGFKNYGNIRTSYIILKGSVAGPAKRQILMTVPIRITKKTKKGNYDLVKLE